LPLFQPLTELNLTSVSCTDIIHTDIMQLNLQKSTVYCAVCFCRTIIHTRWVNECSSRRTVSVPSRKPCAYELCRSSHKGRCFTVCGRYTMHN